MTRHIFLGDIHGCVEEVTSLLKRLRLRDDDIVVSLGDLVRKGPAPDVVIKDWMRHRRLAVAGNNDVALVSRSHSFARRNFAKPRDRRVMKDKAQVEWLRALPLFLDFPEIGVVAVHGGILPNSETFSPALVSREAALELRYVRRDGNGRWQQVPNGEQSESDSFWTDVWNGDRMVVYGHTPRKEPRVDKAAIGLDTGCVYGGKLSAAVFDGRGKWSIEQVAARRRYAG
jgi:predicted phosphodiesterase